jgi:hypothetical protein
MSKSCANCALHKNGECSKGETGFEYCTSGDFELWQPFSAEVQAKIATEVNAARDQELLDVDNDPEEPVTPTDAPGDPSDYDDDEDGASEEQSKEEIEKSAAEALKGMAQAMGLSEEDAKAMAETQAKLATEETFKGYNGREQQDNVVLSDTCKTCKNYADLTGCFLNKMTECVKGGRFMYEAADGAQAVPLEGEALEKYRQGEQGGDYIDGLMHSENQARATDEDEAHIDDLLG